VRAEVIALACELPAEKGVPLSRWSSQALAPEAVARGVGEQISDVTVLDKPDSAHPSRQLPA
jgi:hypothetical protein